MICSALMVNVHRIWRHKQQLAQNKGQEAASLRALSELVVEALANERYWAVDLFLEEGKLVIGCGVVVLGVQ